MYAIISDTETIGWFYRPTVAMQWLLGLGPVEVLHIVDPGTENPYITMKVKCALGEVMIAYWSYPLEAEAYPPKPFRKVE